MFSKKKDKKQNAFNNANAQLNKKEKKKAKKGFFDKDEHDFEDLMEDLDNYN